MKTYYILDGYSLIYKSYFAFVRNPMTNPAGENSSAVFGFFRTLFSFFDKYSPEYFLVALDSVTPTFRHDMFSEYKATRDKTPDDLHAQIPRIEAILKAMGVATLRMNGYEADDIIATYAKRCEAEGSECRIITGDKDLLQLVSDNVKVLRYDKNSCIELDRSGVVAKWEVQPEQILDYLALCGDKADNIPGVKGIGPKKAVLLLQTYGNIDGIYANIDKINGADGTRLEAGRDDCMISRKLVELCTEVPLKESLETFSTASFDYKAPVPLLEKEGIKSVVKWLEKKTSSAEEGTLFADSLFDQPEIPSGTYTTATKPEQLDALVKEIEKAGIYAFDIETTASGDLSDCISAVSVSTKAGTGYRIPVLGQENTEIPENEIKEKLRHILENPALKLVGYDIKSCYKNLCRWGIQPAGIWFDAMVAAWLADIRTSNYGIDHLAEQYLGCSPAEAGSAERADVIFRIYEHLLPMIKAGYNELFFNVEMPLVTILGDMELTGIGIDKGILERYAAELEGKLRDIEKTIYSECGKEFNINSPQQLQEILFTERGLKPTKKTKTGFSTDTSVLEELSEEDIVPKLILAYRTLAKLKSTYVDALPLLTDADSRLHTTFRQTGTATGRLSSINPNLQNIPVRDEEGREIRRAFTAKAGMQFLSADYSQIELVVLAHLSQDRALTEAFKAGIDIHALTASLIFGVPTEQIAPEQRRIAKVINFGVIYGMSAFRLSKELSIPVKQASEFINLYFEKYSGIRGFIDKTLEYARSHGTVRTILGRERFINGINSSNHNERSGAERMAFNSPIQGSAADIVKTAMISIAKRLKTEKLKSKMVLQIHDELIFEVPECEAETMKKLVKEEMENAMKLDVPLRVSIETAKSWGDMH